MHQPSFSSYEESLIPVASVARQIAIQCKFCRSQGFRRSTLRMEDLKYLFLMRYPVRCLRCSKRQRVSFTVARISEPSRAKQRKARHKAAREKARQGR
ncbi:hypothetical protein [Granulicella sp. dw_53]|uniref:hypothetical protein n=1 Tax=Granulicella sp. dw_53 TaxID=2719792 RepID=UPI001BD5391C|nr:hypothetical protein [Granulicella sp. dw_53]